MEKIKIIKETHEKTGHTGYIRFSNEIKNYKKYYWKNIYKDCKLYIENCPICLNKRGGKEIIPVSKQILPGGPLERVAADTWELPKYLKIKTNFTWVLDCIDYFSKFIQSYPLTNKDSNNVFKAIKEFTYTLGIPNILQTDNGLEFLNKELTDFCNKHNIAFIQPPARNPKCNGIVEVSHKEIRNHVLTKYALNEDNDADLKDILLEACYIHNNNVHTSTKKKPIDLIKNTDKDIYLEVLENIKNSLS